MAGMGDRLWDIGRSPAQHMTVLVFGLLALLTGIVATSILAVAGGGGGATSIIMAALILRGVGGFFVTLALFLWAYAASGHPWTKAIWPFGNTRFSAPINGVTNAVCFCSG